MENGGSNLQFSLPLPDLTGVSALRKGLYWIMQTDLGAMAGEGEVGGGEMGAGDFTQPTGRFRKILEKVSGSNPLYLAVCTHHRLVIKLK